jgi:hypothetical protein
MVVILFLWIKEMIYKIRKKKQSEKDFILERLSNSKKKHIYYVSLIYENKKNTPIYFLELLLKATEYEIKAYDHLYNKLCNNENYIKEAKKEFSNILGQEDLWTK